MRDQIRIAVVIAAMWAGLVQRAEALDHLTFTHNGEQRQASGKLLVDSDEGGIYLLLTADGTLWQVLKKDLVKRAADDAPFALADSDSLKAQFGKEFAGYRIHATEHFLICYNTSRAYAEWCGTLYERVYDAFFAYWKARGVELKEPSAPLIALVFQDQKSYVKYAEPELGEVAPAVVGYYSLMSNRIIMYDMTGVEGAGLGDKGGLSARVNAILSRPGAEGTVATIVHETTHQLAFNSGMHQRLGAVPRWLSEGMAMYCETPDLKNSRGWKSIGAVSATRLAAFRQYLPKRPADSLATLIASDDRLTNTKTAKSAYAEAWALNYYLIINHREQYAKYLETLAEKPPLIPDSPEEKLNDFTDAFGEDLGKLDTAFLKFMAKVKP